MKTLRFFLPLLTAVILNACFTGIESTPAISDSDLKKEKGKDKPESSYLASLRPQPFAQWTEGKQWYVTDPKIKLIFGADAANLILNEGDILHYVGAKERVSVTGDDIVDLYFLSPSGRRLTYSTSRSMKQLTTADATLDIPYAVELKLIDDARQLMKGKTYYIITSSWYDTNNQGFRGRRFVAVTVDDIHPGNAYYPLLLRMIDEQGQPFHLFMTAGNDAQMPRRFDSIFSLSNPRAKYPAITDEVWQLIINGRVQPNMTRDECRLSLGSPSSIDRRPGYSYLREIWSYDGGVYLIFEDGLLKSFRQ